MATFATRREHSARTRRNHNAASRNRRRGLFLERLENRELLALVSYWTGDNTPLDAVGSNDGTLINGATYAAGQVGQAFSFDGVDDRVGVADAPSLALTGSMSIEAWVKANAYPTAEHGLVLFRGDDRGGLDPYQLTLASSGEIRFSVSSLTDSTTVLAPIPTGEFIHVVGTLDDATGDMRLYLNGILVSQVVTTVRPFGELDEASNPGVGIGSHGGYPSTPHKFLFQGLIDELKLYDHALSAQDIVASFDASKGDLQPTISIRDVTATEGATSTYLDKVFVVPHSGGLAGAHQAVQDPTSNDWYVASGATNSVLQYDGNTGAFVGTVVPAGSSGLQNPWGLILGPDGKLYVAGRNSDNILTYDPATQVVAEFIPAGNGLWAPVGMTFGADGQLYVANSDRGVADTSLNQDQVLRFAGPGGGPNQEPPGTFIGVFVAAGSGGADALDNPNQLAFYGEHLYVTNTRRNSVNRYNGETGTFDQVFVGSQAGGLSVPNYLSFQADGLLYLASQGTGEVLRYDGSSGEFVDVFSPRPVGIAAGAPQSIARGADGLFYVPYNREVLRYDRGEVAQFVVQLSTPFPTTVSVDYSTANGTAVSGNDYFSSAGTLSFAPGEWAKTIVVPIKNDLVGEPTETFLVNLTNAAEASISDGVGIGTIVDDDPGPTKFFVVDDGSPDRTYEYGAQGKAHTNYTIATGNTAPRGAASTAAGNKVWVVDANKKVYVYDAQGRLLGSWTAGSLGGSAQLEGIATNGIDIWLVDNKADKVFRYANAANRLSGTQNATSSFTLYNKGPFSPDYSNKNPKDIVTDGNFLWVLNDGVSEDKLFKYTLTGTPLWQNGWTLDLASSQPTGVTLDPANPNDFWIVDAGTDRVYRYAGAVFQDGGGLPHPFRDSFALAAGNTNPQGIADPPVDVAVREASKPAESRKTARAHAAANDEALLALLGDWDLFGGQRKRRR
jgi:hypothetical protein